MMDWIIAIAGAIGWVVIGWFGCRWWEWRKEKRWDGCDHDFGEVVIPARAQYCPKCLTLRLTKVGEEEARLWDAAGEGL